MRIKNKVDARLRRKLRGRQRIIGTDAVPRVSVYRSVKHIYAQIVDDIHGKTLASACSVEIEVKSKGDSINKTEQARIVGDLIGQRAINKDIKKVVFDRGGCLYHGRIKALADAARKVGLEF